MLRAMLPSPGLPEGGAFPQIVEQWRAIRIDRRHLRSFVETTGLPAGKGISLLHAPAAAAASILYPHVFGFPLQMALLTHRAAPLPVWGVLQVRNHFLLHRRYSEHELLELVTRVAGQRVLPKGVEVDLYSILSARNECVWEGLTTFYYRGRYGPGQAASPLAKPRSGTWPEVDRWRMPPYGSWRFAGLTGDYNGIHWWNWWARRMGFKAAFYQSQRAVGHSLVRLTVPASGRQRLDVWLKGPVYHHSVVRLEGSAGPNKRWFALSMEGSMRPSIVGRWSAAAPGSRLIDEQDVPLPLEDRT